MYFFCKIQKKKKILNSSLNKHNIMHIFRAVSRDILKRRAYTQNPQPHKASACAVLTHLSVLEKSLDVLSRWLKLKPKQQKQTKERPEAAFIFTEILVWFHSNYGVKKCDKDPCYDANDKWLTDKKKWRGRQAVEQVNIRLS